MFLPPVSSTDSLSESFNPKNFCFIRRRSSSLIISSCLLASCKLTVVDSTFALNSFLIVFQHEFKTFCYALFYLFEFHNSCFKVVEVRKYEENFVQFFFEKFEFVETQLGAALLLLFFVIGLRASLWCNLLLSWYKYLYPLKSLHCSWVKFICHRRARF